MTEQELRRAEWAGQPSRNRRSVRKAKLKGRYRTRESMLHQMQRTIERLDLLVELYGEQYCK